MAVLEVLVGRWCCDDQCQEKAYARRGAYEQHVPRTLWVGKHNMIKRGGHKIDEVQ